MTRDNRPARAVDVRRCKGTLSSFSISAQGHRTLKGRTALMREDYDKTALDSTAPAGL